MRLKRIHPILAACLLAGAACGDDRAPLPTQPPANLTPTFALTTKQSDAYKHASQVIIPRLFPAGILRTSAQAQLLAIKNDMDATPPRLERAKLRAWGFIFYTGGLYHNDKLLEPEGPTTTQDDVLAVICDASIIALLKLEERVCNLNGSSLGEDGTITVVNSSADDVPDVVVTESKSVALQIPPGNGNLVVAISRYLDSHILQTRFRELAPKWRIALSPTPAPLDPSTPDVDRFVASACVINDPESEFRPDELDEPYVHVIHVRSDNGKATAAQRTKALAENGGCKVGEHVALAPSSQSGTSFASRTLHQVRRLASAVGSFFSPQPAYAKGRVYMFDVGGIGGLLLDMGSDFPLGVVYPDLRIQTAPTLSSSSVVQGGSVSISSWQIRNIQLNELNADQPPRPCTAPGEGCVEVRAPGEAPGDVAVVHEDVTLPDVRHGYYLSANQVLDAGDIPLTTSAAAPRSPRTALFAGGSATVDGEGRTLNIPADAPTGPQYILAVVDDDRSDDVRGVVPEVQPLEGNGNSHGEANNVVAVPITVTPSRVDPTPGTVLLYGPANETATFKVKAVNAGWTVTEYTATQWLNATRAQFESFDVIAIPSIYSGNSRPNLAAGRNDKWGPAITGNIVVTGLHADWHQNVGATVFLGNALDWAAAGSGTGFVALMDCGSSEGFTAPYSWLPTGAPFDAPTGRVNGQCVDANVFNITDPDHPVMAGLSGTSLLNNWGASLHTRFTNVGGFSTITTIGGTSTFAGSPAVLVKAAP